ncbi:3-hydroxylacyl-ACP dehydratase [Acidihalobacter prosperus]
MNSVALDKTALCALIPHDGDMCLLDAVVDWDEENIRCRSASHRLADHPLRREDGTLGASHLLEYAAQAAAVHGGLLAAAENAVPTPGYLVATRRLQLHAERIDTLPGDLDVAAHRLFAGPGGWVYEFEIAHADAPLADGQFTIAHLDVDHGKPQA